MPAGFRNHFLECWPVVGLGRLHLVLKDGVRYIRLRFRVGGQFAALGLNGDIVAVLGRPQVKGYTLHF